MKKVIIKTLVILSILILTLAGCSKDEDSDPRDQFVGTYTYMSSETLIIKMLQEEQSQTIRNEGIFIISKASESNKIKLTYGELNGKTYEYTVVDKNFSGTTPLTENTNGLVLSGTETDKGKLNGTILTIEESATGTLTVATSGLTGTFKMNGTITAIKK